MRTPPRCISGRWSSLHECEDRLLASPPGSDDLTPQIVDVFVGALEKTHKPFLAIRDGAAPPAIQNARDADLETEGVSIETTAAYTKRSGRWASELSRMIRLPAFMFLMSVCFITRAPAMHVMYFLQVAESDTEWNIKYGCDSTVLSVLACGKASEFMTAFEALLDVSTWADLMDRAPMAALADGLGFGAIVYLSCAAAGDFYRRVLLQCNAFPLRLLCLVKSPPGDVCALRRAVARELLTAPVDQFGVPEANAVRLSKLWRTDLEQAAGDGRLSHSLYIFLASVRRMWRADTQEWAMARDRAPLDNLINYIGEMI
jgi:hypothetical protein